MRPAHEASAIVLQRFLVSRVVAGRRILDTATRVSSVLSRPTAAQATALVAVEEIGDLADLTGAKANQDTTWPEGFDPEADGVTFED